MDDQLEGGRDAGNAGAARARRMSPRQPTPHPDVNTVLRAVLAGVNATLGRRLVGMYLSGSLATGDFIRDRSDIDFVVVTDVELPSHAVSALAEMHTRLAASNLPWATELDGWYLPLRSLRPDSAAFAAHPHIDRGGRLAIREDDCEAVIRRCILRTHGITVAGPSPVGLVDDVNPDELRAASSQIVRQWWAPMLDNPAPLETPGYQDYAALTMCRALYTAAFGAVVSKPAAARWARSALGPSWSEFIAEADAWRNGMPFDHMSRTLDLIRYTVEALATASRVGDARVPRQRPTRRRRR